MLQAAGGGIAASAGRQGSALLLDAGNGLIVAGIAFQVFTMSICGLLILDFAIRFWRSKPGHASDTLTPEKTAYQMDLGDAKKMTSLKTFCCAIVIAYLTVLIRCIYRLPEMAGGWGNPLMQKENEFLLLDGIRMIAIAALALTAAHPGIFFQPMRRFATKKIPDSLEQSVQSQEK
ncbi:hypothetical protein LTS08_005456 [Lithohypha guttulata]|uniref:Uncharacterized protein n=1 Tax=Lithohypha guttulata TaxID=1690604 RepID=A0AAN7T2P7_9EURO|nr:hypothetical protein LTR51_003365 [Lithohypha guttulata]KAK5087189.1 hypothetical protein LTR05_004360 [Lithohypha guttulata]KAK5099741.1 hypothetical protein LTS08_005456 [Lithohypha guttulata]